MAGPPPRSGGSSSRRRKGYAVGLIRKKGEWNPNKWGILFSKECLDNPKMTGLPLPSWPEGEGEWKRKGKWGGKGKKKKKKGASCAVM